MYDKAYLNEYKRRASTEIGQRIYQLRWELVEKYCHTGVLLDYGCASGAFHSSSRNGFTAYGYDVNPHSGFSVMPMTACDILTMWDVIEHLPNPLEPIVKLKPKWVFISTPNIEASTGDVSTFKHFKPGEHIWYFSPKGLEAMMLCEGYKLVETNYLEGLVRDSNNPEAIVTSVFVK